MKYNISNKMKDMEGSAIRAVLKMTQSKDLITFAAGVPDPTTLPADFIAKKTDEILAKNPALALQYGVTDGYAPLVASLSERMKKLGVNMEENGVMVTSGGQQVIDLTARCLLNEGDVVAVEAPTFIGGLNTFRSYNAKCMGVSLENDGLDVNALEDLCKKEKVKLLYTIPTFQNPGGVTMSIEKRKAILELADKYDFMILEDNPYGELRFAGSEVPVMKSMDKNGRVVYAGTLSKVIAPGLRVGWDCAPRAVLEKMIVAKQVIDVHTTMLSQIVANEFINSDGYDAHIEKCRKLYGDKCNLMMKCMDEFFPEKATHTSPEGGLFLWCDLNDGSDTRALMEKAVAKGVCYIPGYTFMTDVTKPTSTLRLNYSIPSMADIEKGIEILGSVFKQA